MLEVVIKFLCSLIGSVAGILIIENISKIKFKLNLKNIILLILLSVITTLQFKTEYTITISLTVYILIIMIYKWLFNMSYKKSVLLGGVVLIITSMSDLMWAIILKQFFTNDQLREPTILFLMFNMLVYSSAYFLSHVFNYKRFLTKFIAKTDNSKIYSQFIFIILTVVVSCLIIYDITSLKIIGMEQYIITLSTFVLMLILVLIYIKSKNDNDKLQEQFDYLYNYSKNYEDWITKEQLNIHENKNQLIVLRDMVKKNEKAVNYINEILEEDFVIEDKWIGQLSNIPKGGLKGLLYYKLITIEKDNLNFCVDISKNVKTKLKKLQKDQLKDISHIIGIFIDNAIEASVNSKKKMFSLEIYCIKKELNIVITNSFDGQIELNKINNNGYSTKGKDRGKGLYFVSKIKEKNPNILTEAHIINNYFVQKIVIK